MHRYIEIEKRREKERTSINKICVCFFRLRQNEALSLSLSPPMCLFLHFSIFVSTYIYIFIDIYTYIRNYISISLCYGLLQNIFSKNSSKPQSLHAYTNTNRAHLLLPHRCIIVFSKTTKSIYGSMKNIILRIRCC